MIRIKKICFWLLLILPATLSVRAQEQRDTIRAESRTAARPNLRETLGLSREQVQKLRSLNQHYREKIQALQADSTLSHEERRQENHVLQVARRKELMKILTPAQQEKLQTYRREQHIQKRKANKKGEKATG